MHCAYCGSWVDHVSYAPCASCNRPTNGAQVRVVRSASSNPGVIIAAAVAGLLVVVAIIGILAAIAIPNLLTAMQRSRQKRTMADIRTVAAIVESHRQHKRAYPAAESMNALQSEVGVRMPHFDGWGNELRYRCTDEECNGYAISSAGADRVFERVKASEYASGTTTSFDEDLVWVDGEFVRAPEGAR